MPFWKKDKKAAAVQENGSASNGTTTSNGSNSSGENGVGSSSNGGGAWVKDPKVNYKARLEHKQYLVSGLGIWSVQDFLGNMGIGPGWKLWGFGEGPEADTNFVPCISGASSCRHF